MKHSELMSDWSDLFFSRKPRVSFKQKAVLEHAQLFKAITLNEAVELIGAGIYANKKKHVGALLSNMVKRGLLVRESRGVFKLPTAQPNEANP